MFLISFIMKNAEQEVIVSDFLRISNENIITASNEINGNEEQVNLDDVVYVNINHYSNYKKDDFVKAYKALATSSIRFEQMIFIGDLYNKLVTQERDNIFKELLLKDQKGLDDKTKGNAKNNTRNKPKKTITKSQEIDEEAENEEENVSEDQSYPLD